MAIEERKTSQSGACCSRSVEKVFDDSRYSGVLDLSGHNLTEYPDYAGRYDLIDTLTVDLSRNHFSEIPCDIYLYWCLENLNCYHNFIKSLPENVGNLQNLVTLNLCRNQLTVLPTTLGQLPCLEILLVNNNRLVSLPEEIGQLRRLMELDVSCNEISQLPEQIADITSLRNLNVRCNKLVHLPTGLCQLQLSFLDVSKNCITHIPVEFHMLSSLEVFNVNDNPLTFPPSSVYRKGVEHILKSLRLSKKASCADRQFSMPQNIYVNRVGEPSFISDFNHNMQILGNPVIKHRTAVDDDENTKAYNFSHQHDDQSAAAAVCVQPEDADTDGFPRYEVWSVDTHSDHNTSESVSVQGSGSQDRLSDNDALSEEQSCIETEIIRPRSDSAPVIETKLPSSQQMNRDSLGSYDDSSLTPYISVQPSKVERTDSDPRTIEIDKAEYRRQLEAFQAAQQREAYHIRQRLKTAATTEDKHEHVRSLHPKQLHLRQISAPLTIDEYSENGFVVGAGKRQLAEHPSDPTEYNPLFTIRRNIHQGEEGLGRIHQLRKTIKDLLKMDLPRDMSSSLSDGIILCHLANHIYPRCVSHIHVPTPSVPVLPLTKRQKNVDSFLTACRAVGVDEELICKPAAILEGSAMVDIAVTVRALISRSAMLQQSIV